MTEKHKAEEWETEHYKAHQHKTEPHKAEKAAKTADELHEEMRDCINASQEGAVQEMRDGMLKKFPGLVPPPEPPPPEPEVEMGTSGTKKKK